MWCWPWQHRGPQASSLPPCEQPEMGGLGSCLGERAGGSQKGRMMWEGPEERREGSEGERVGLWSLPFDGHLGPSGPGHTPPRAKAVSAYPAVPSENRRARGSSISTRDRPRPAAHKTEAGSLAAGTVADSAALPEMTHSRTSSGAWQEGGRRRRPSRSGARRPPAPAEMPLPLRPPSRVIATLSTSCAIYRQRGVRREGEAAAGVPGRRRGCQNAEGRGPAPPDRHPPGSAFQHPHSHSKVDRNVFI